MYKSTNSSEQLPNGWSLKVWEEIFVDNTVLGIEICRNLLFWKSMVNCSNVWRLGLVRRLVHFPHSSKSDIGFLFFKSVGFAGLFNWFSGPTLLDFTFLRSRQFFLRAKLRCLIHGMTHSEEPLLRSEKSS